MLNLLTEHFNWFFICRLYGCVVSSIRSIKFYFQFYLWASHGNFYWIWIQLSLLKKPSFSTYRQTLIVIVSESNPQANEIETRNCRIVFEQSSMVGANKTDRYVCFWYVIFLSSYYRRQIHNICDKQIINYYKCNEFLFSESRVIVWLKNWIATFFTYLFLALLSFSTFASNSIPSSLFFYIRLSPYIRLTACVYVYYTTIHFLAGCDLNDLLRVDRHLISEYETIYLLFLSETETFDQTLQRKKTNTHVEYAGQGQKENKTYFCKFSFWSGYDRSGNFVCTFVFISIQLNTPQDS